MRADFDADVSLMARCPAPETGSRWRTPLIIDELGYVPLSTTGAELLFEIFSQRYERGSSRPDLQLSLCRCPYPGGACHGRGRTRRSAGHAFGRSDRAANPRLV